MNEISFRTARPSDIDNIMLLECACFNEMTQESKSIYLERIEQFPHGFLILEYKGRFAGAISSEIWTRSSEISAEVFALGHSITQQEISGDELYISSMGILPEYNRKGYGNILFRKLIGSILKDFGNIQYGILIVNERWTGAYRIYRKNGFCDSGRIQAFFKEDDGSYSDGIIMRHDNIRDVFRTQ